MIIKRTDTGIEIKGDTNITIGVTRCRDVLILTELRTGYAYEVNVSDEDMQIEIAEMADELINQPYPSTDAVFEIWEAMLSVQEPI